MNNDREIILSIKNLKQYFKIPNATIRAVDNISFNIYKGEVLGIVGESGSGKSTTGRSIIRLYKPIEGEIIFKGKNISGKIDKKTNTMLRKKMQMIFQDPIASLNPRMKVLDIIAEGLDIHEKISDVERKERVYEILEVVGLNKEHANRYPHEFSGGQRQRIGVARAIIMNPEFIIADEPISALDVSIQAQIVNLMRKLQKERGLTYMFIAHDLSMVKYISDRIAVMHLGHIVEIGDSDSIYNNPIHPYTKSLLSAIPLPDPQYEKNRKRLIYNAKPSDYVNREYKSVSYSHVVLANDDEYYKWVNSENLKTNDLII
ncbi:ATP-binding cassette domain-containing protein [Clostridiaceae bacterium M8S5]|nr:ATP-binding cassette domain-containing protein [Clostridiaceae bacterium M8S5]